MTESKYIIIVPVYNGADHISRFYESVPEEFRSNLLFINDGSSDRTSEWLKNSNTQYIEHKTNLGKGAAISTGINAAREKKVEFVITMDIDLQHTPESLKEFVYLETDDFVCGYRHPRGNMPLQRQASNFITSMLLSVRCNRIIKDSQCGYRRIPLSFFKYQSVKEMGFQAESEILIKASILGYGISHIKVPTVYTGSVSSIKPVRDTIKFIELWLRSYLWN